MFGVNSTASQKKTPSDGDVRLCVGECFSFRLSLHRLEEREEPVSDSSGCVRLHRGQRLRPRHLRRYSAYVLSHIKTDFRFLFKLNKAKNVTKKQKKTYKNK